MAAQGKPDEIVLINLSGRGDKDVWSAARALGTEIKL
jgi:tryptophan synthase beta subunit